MRVLSATPLVSAGPPTELTAIAGNAAISIGGSPTTRYWWLPFLVGVVTAAVVSLAVEGLVAWVRHGQTPE
jgi:hypothetical protein